MHGGLMGIQDGWLHETRSSGYTISPLAAAAAFLMPSIFAL
jgi:hypothetical protein